MCPLRWLSRSRDFHCDLVVLPNEKAAFYARERIVTVRATRG
jgi:hypothetical protein